jgi:hypothetical protein
LDTTVSLAKQSGVFDWCGPNVKILVEELRESQNDRRERKKRRYTGGGEGVKLKVDGQGSPSGKNKKGTFSQMTMTEKIVPLGRRGQDWGKGRA